MFDPFIHLLPELEKRYKKAEQRAIEMDATTRGSSLFANGTTSSSSLFASGTGSSRSFQQRLN
jgi:hypothetical protein